MLYMSFSMKKKEMMSVAIKRMVSHLSS